MLKWGRCRSIAPGNGGGMAMLSTSERKKKNFTKYLLPAHGAELKKYDELYELFCAEGYTKDLCDQYADEFVNNVKKPAVEDIVQTAKLYDKIHDKDSASFYLSMLEDRKLSGEDKFGYCIEMLKNLSKAGKWRDAEDFRTEHINFMQNFAQKRSPQEQADMYIALALTDCAAKRYTEAFKLLKFGYKPQGKNDTKLLEILTTGVYIFACAGDSDGLASAVGNAQSCVKLFTGFEHPWCHDYYEKCIDEAAESII